MKIPEEIKDKVETYNEEKKTVERLEQEIIGWAGEHKKSSSAGRLTWKNPDGTWGLKDGEIKNTPRELYGALCKLKDYEETGLMPDEVAELKDTAKLVDEIYLKQCREINNLRRQIEDYKKIYEVEECKGRGC